MATPQHLTVTAADDDPAGLVADGQIDSHTSPMLDEALGALAPDATVSLELSAVTFIDSSGIRVLVKSHKRQAGGGGSLTLANPSPPVLRLLELTGLTGALNLTP